MSILLGIKKYFYLALGVLGSVFMAWVYFLKKDNEAKKDKIEDLEYEAKVTKKVFEEEKKVAKFEGAVDTAVEDLGTLKEKTDIEYNKAKEKSNDKANTNSDDYTFA